MKHFQTYFHTLPRALSNRLSALFIALCMVALLPLFGCGGLSQTTITPKPTATPTPPLDPSVTQIVVKPNDDQAVQGRAIILDTMPAGFLPGNKRVSMTTLTRDQAAIAYTARSGQPMPNIAGWFTKGDSHNDPAIVFIGDGWGDYLRHMALHEWGHFVQLENCTEAEFQAWRVAWGSAKARNTLPSTYAATNEYEGWAEAVAALYEGKTIDPELKAVVDAVLSRMSADRQQSRSERKPAPSSSAFPGCAVTRN